MLSGRRLDLLEPSPLDIEIGDIAHGLARVARWNGQTKGAHAFSVAQHSVLVERLVAELSPRLSREARLMALLHDAPEYVVGDLISPFKAAVGINYKALEERLQAAIHLRFGLPAICRPITRPPSWPASRRPKPAACSERLPRPSKRPGWPPWRLARPRTCSWPDLTAFMLNSC
jgi:5'-deoxynucleotidase YfbR-like HD superfamily hydrolase